MHTQWETVILLLKFDSTVKSQYYIFSLKNGNGVFILGRYSF